MLISWKVTPEKPVDVWETWLAWYPVFVECERDECRLIWLEKVERKSSYGYNSIEWRYREILK